MCFWSLDQRLFENLGVMSVHPCVPLYVALFLGNCSSDFSEILYEVRVQNVRKKVLSSFVIFTNLVKNSQNCPLWNAHCPLQLPSRDLIHKNFDFWYLYQLVVETLGDMSVHPYIRTWRFSRKPFISFFSETLQLVSH